MAIINWVNFSNGDTGLSIRDAINAALTAARDWINTADTTISGHTTSIGNNTAAIATNTADIATNAGDIATLEAGVLYRVDTDALSTDSVGTAEALTTSFQKLDFFATTTVASTNSHISNDTINDRIVINTTGVYKLTSHGTAEGPSNGEVEYSYFKNGVEVNPGGNPIFAMRGTGKPVAIGDSILLSLTATDYLEVFAKVDSATDVITHAHTIVEKVKY